MSAAGQECHSVDADNGITSGSEERSTWEPGDPINPGRSGFGGYLYNFREIQDDEHCTCGDLAGWPEPALWGHRLPEEDPLEKFIAEYRIWKRRNHG